MLKYLCGAKLIYDTHELETESAGSYGVRKVLSKIVERSLIGFADVVIVVSASISDWYKNTYRLASVPVVRNFPICPKIFPPGKDDYLRRKFEIEEDAIVFLYLGVLAAGRGVEILLDAFSQTKSKVHMIFMGYGNMADEVKDYEKRFSNIHFHPAVSPEDISRHMFGADVGVSLIENICLSYYYCLPNKLFMYLSNGLPVIVSNFPEMEKIIKEKDCGWSVGVDVGAIKRLLETLTREDIDRKRENAIESMFKYDWSVEEKILLDTYTNLFAPKLCVL
jgi:glycosyltransferase involved in cell wall biosynthesis